MVGKLSSVMGVYALVTPMRVSWWRREAGGEAAGVGLDSPTCAGMHCGVQIDGVHVRDAE